MTQKTCCFTGHRPEKLVRSKDDTFAALSKAVNDAIERGYTVFITGVARGVDLWAAQIVMEIKKSNPVIKLVSALPFDSYHADDPSYEEIIESSDDVPVICGKRSRWSYNYRDKWMVDRSSLIIAVYDGKRGGTRNTVRYAEKNGKEVMYL